MDSEADIKMRRICVATMINMAANSTANYELVGVTEGLFDTCMTFELTRPYQGVDRTNVAYLDIRITTRPKVNDASTE